MHGDVTGGLRQMEPAFEPLDGIGLFVLLPAVVMVDTLARAGRDRDALALIARLLGKTSDPQVGMLSPSFGVSAASWSRASAAATGRWRSVSCRRRCVSRAGRGRRSCKRGQESRSQITWPSAGVVRKRGRHSRSRG